ncbi:hypothetical protein N7510_002695 [Penicillium lagena]|uniref:uncharacterized protein n=1 Tax=Penicillium lagena TaxID=94218 RepID=UPI00254062A1|nr:uncharacterized protein N7510_002695 [Penicillium lagena]KAJ5626386.1 hypothetical protein N7510_002695 [Penicillium lagena]
MVAIRKMTLGDRRQSFRSRLQCALSLTSSESEDNRSLSRSAAGDATENEFSIQEEDDCSGNQQRNSLADGSEEEVPPDWSVEFRNGNEREIPPLPDLSGDCNMIAFECVAELDVRMKSMENSLNSQSSWNETVRNDLAGILNRLAIVETMIEKIAKPAERTTKEATPEGHRVGRTLRSQQ